VSIPDPTRSSFLQPFVQNLPLGERSVRLALAVALVAVGFLFVPPGALRWLVFGAAAGAAVTAVAGYCPACALAGRRLARGKMS
jgi:hypothetical protein